MPAPASGCESQEPRPVGAGRAFGMLWRAGSPLWRCPCGHGRPPGGALHPRFGKDDSPPPAKGDHARERNRGRWSPGFTERRETPLVSGGRGLQAPGYLSVDNFANSGSLRPASPASPPLACSQHLAAFGSPPVRFPWRGALGSGCWHLLVRTRRLPSCSVEIMRVPVCRLFG